jgi:hypothetical protein
VRTLPLVLTEHGLAAAALAKEAAAAGEEAAAAAGSAAVAAMAAGAATATEAGAMTAAAAASSTYVHVTSFLSSTLYPSFSAFSLPPLM